MTVLVIGCGGYMGRHLMSGLQHAGLNAIGVSSSDGTGIAPSSGLLPLEFDVPAGTSEVVYMAQSPFYRDVPDQSSHVLSVNTLSAVRAAVKARAAGVRRFIYVSTGTVYAPSFSPLSEDSPVQRNDWYSLSKLHGEEALAMFRNDMEVIVVRPFGVYGANQSGRLIPNLISSIKSGRAITLQPRVNGAKDEDGLRISLCYIDDATSILIRLVSDGGPECLNLAGEKAVSIREISETIGAYVGAEPNFHVSEIPREFDLIADTKKLIRALDPSFCSFKDGIRQIAASLS